LISCTASAPGKCILIGEHAVVYGTRAIVTALNLRAHVSVNLLSEKKILIDAVDFKLKKEFPFLKDVKFEQHYLPLMPILKCCNLLIRKFNLNQGIKLKIWSEIPPSAGLGSSAAVSVATIKAIECIFGLNLKNDEISQLAFEIEKIVHSKPSGIDNYVCTFGGCILYSRKNEIKSIDLPEKLPLIICNSQKSRNTGVLVSRVAQLHEKFPKITQKIFDTIDLLSIDAIDSIKTGNLQKIGEIFNLNQGLLDALGVSTTFLNQLVGIARESGAFGAKLTGAGGGGCIIAVAPPAKQSYVILNLKESGAIPITTEFSQNGVKIESLK